jgi:hypothetical protein
VALSARPAPTPARQTGEAAAHFAVGAEVEVRDRFRGTWCHGFRIAGASEAGYAVMRRSDGYVLPATFAAGRVRHTG